MSAFRNAVFAAAVVALAGGGVRAESATPAFDALRAELVERAATDFDVRHHKAILSAIARIDRDSHDVTGDLKKAVAVTRVLEKAFPEEFAPPGLEAKSPATTNLLLLVFGDVFPQLRDVHIQPQLDDLLYRITTLVPGSPVAPRAAASADAATGFLAAEAASATAYAKNLLKAWKKEEAGRRLVLKGKGQTMTVTIGGDPYPASTMTCGVHDADHGLDVFCIVSNFSYPGVGAAPVAVRVKVLGVTGPGTYPIGADAADQARIGAWNGDWYLASWYLQPGTGTLVVTKFDPAGPWIEGTFQFTGTGGPGGPFPATVDVTATFTATVAVTEDGGTTP